LRGSWGHDGDRGCGVRVARGEEFRSRGRNPKLPNLDRPEFTARGEARTVAVKGDAENSTRMAKDQLFLPREGVQDLHHIGVAAPRQALAVRRKYHAVVLDPGAFRRPGHDRLAGGHVPDLDHAVQAGRYQVPAVRAEVHGRELRGVAL